MHITHDTNVVCIFYTLQSFSEYTETDLKQELILPFGAQSGNEGHAFFFIPHGIIFSERLQLCERSCNSQHVALYSMYGFLNSDYVSMVIGAKTYHSTV